MQSNCTFVAPEVNARETVTVCASALFNPLSFQTTLGEEGLPGAVRSAIVTDFQGAPVRCSDNVETVYDVVASSNPALHETVLKLIAACGAAD